MLKRLFNPTPNNNFNYPQGNFIPNYDYQRLETELNEARRLISDLSKRVSRLEGYLGVNKENYYN